MLPVLPGVVQQTRNPAHRARTRAALRARSERQRQSQTMRRLAQYAAREQGAAAGQRAYLETRIRLTECALLGGVGDVHGGRRRMPWHIDGRAGRGRGA